MPSLITDDGILTETPAILAYIAQIKLDANLAPAGDPFAFARLQEFNSDVCSTLHVAHAHRMRGIRWAYAEWSFADMQRKVPEPVTACYRLIEDRLFCGPWMMGDQYMVADPHLFTVAQCMEGDGVNLASIPAVVDHRARMTVLPNVIQGIAEEQGA